VSTTKASPSIKAAVTEDSSSGEYGDEIDEFIKKHIENEEMEKIKEGLNRFLALLVHQIIQVMLRSKRVRMENPRRPPNSTFLKSYRSSLTPSPNIL
jgi:hypothetical protein